MTKTKCDKLLLWVFIIWCSCLVVSFICTCIVGTTWYFKEPLILPIAYMAAYIGLSLCAIGLLLVIVSETFHRFRNKALLIIISKIFLPLSISAFLAIFLMDYHSLYSQAVCPLNLRNLSHAMIDYCRENKQYPPSDKWCDVILDFTSKNTFRYGKDFRRNLTCPSVPSKECSYAMNPKARHDSRPETVLLFESKEGWSLFGGSELAVFENHKGECCVLFVNGQVKCIKKKDIDKLKW